MADIDLVMLNHLFNLLDTNPREALRTLTPLEVKYPASQIVRSMRILALRKTGSHEKARELAAEFMKEPIAFADENVVHVMWWVLVELNLKADAVACLKLTNDVCQGQNSLVSETYFTALLWNRDLKEMQKQSMALNKRTKNQDYQVWSIMCNVLQVAPGDAKNMLLLLSNKMLEKIFAGDTAKLTRQLLWLHLYVMKRREQYDEALAFLDSKVARDLFPMDDERKAYVIEIYETTGAYAKANIAYKELLRSEHQRDNWFWWDGYFITLERLVAGEPTEEGADATWPSAEAFLGEVTSLEDAVVTNRLRRATPLAARHLLWLRVKAGLAEAADLVKSTASYIAWMKYKPQSHMDVAKFLPVIAEKGCAAALVDAIGSPSKPASDLVSLSHELAKHRAAFSLGLYNDISDEDLRAHLAAFIELSTASAPLSKDLEKTEKPYGDDALQLGALLLLNRFCRTDERRYLAQCLVLLELLPLPKNNTHLQQWQLLLPPLLGVNTQAAVSEELDIKFIQRESLTYMLHSTALSLGSEEEQTFLSQRVSSFHDRFDGHNGNIAISAWNKLACSKIFEMEQFRSALAASCVWRESAVENVLTQFLASTDTAHTRKVLDLIDRTVPNMSTTPQDNQDTKCVASTVLCAPESELSQTLTAKLLSSTHAPKDVETQRRPLLQAKYHMLKCMQALFHASDAASQKAEPTKAKAKGKKKTAEEPKQEAVEVTVDWWAAVAEHAKLTHEAYSAVPVSTVDNIATNDIATASHNVLIELFKVVQNAASSVEATKCGVEALGSALVALAAQLTAQSAPWKDAQWTETKSTTYALRGAVPMVVTCLQHLTSARSLKERIAGGALPGALTTFTDALKITAEHAKALSAHIKPLNDNAQILREVSACAAEQWQGSDAAVGAFAGKVQASWLAALKRIATSASNFQFEVQGCARLL